MKTTRAEKVVFGVVGGLMAMAALAAIGNANAATHAVTPPPAIARALNSVTNEYCEMVATANANGATMKHLRILGLHTKISEGIDWPLVLNYRRECAPTKADLHIYNQANAPEVKKIRNHFHAPVYSPQEAINFCAKRENVTAAPLPANWPAITYFQAFDFQAFDLDRRIVRDCFSPAVRK